jgi:serine/threonine protein kinase
MHPNEFGDPFILDFGISRFVDKMTNNQLLPLVEGDSPRLDNSSTTTTATYSPIGRLRYRPPEICNQTKYYSKRVDVYFFGTVLYELLTGLKPFANVKRDR